MASTTHSGTTVPASTTSAAQDIPVRNTSNDTEPFPVEMSSLQAETAIPETLAEQDTHTSDSTTQIRNRAMRTDTTTAILSSQNPPSPPPPLPTSKPDLARIRSTAIGESHDSEPITKDLDETDTGPKLMITLLLLTGARHPFNLDSKYLTKRSVKVKEDDPFNLSVYKVKELILREWRDEWEMKPSSPSAIRLISFGKVLDDKAAVRDLKFNPAAANVVHMSIKPQDFMDEEDAKGSKTARGHNGDGGEERSPGCRCIIM